MISSFNQVGAQVAAHKACSSGYENPVLFDAWFGFDGCGRVITIRKLGTRLCSLHRHLALGRVS